MSSRSLTEKEEKFCQEYLIDLNATQAAIRSGYSKKTSHSIGHENLKKPEIASRISNLRKGLIEKTGITQERVLLELTRMGLSDIKKYYTQGFQLTDITELPDDLSAAIQSVKTTTLEGEFGSKTTVEFKLHDKKGSLDMIAKHLGFYEQHNNQKNKGNKAVYKLPDGTEIVFGE